MLDRPTQRERSRETPPWWSRVVHAGLFVLASTELLSALGLLRRGPLVSLWIAAALAAGFADARRAWLGARKIAVAVRGATRWETLCAAALGVILSLLAALAFAAAPNNYDSLTYHLPRAMHWAQNGSVAFYPTSVTRQLYLGPFAEYVILHAILLTGSVGLANLVQLGTFVLCLSLAPALARTLGGGRTALWVAVAWTASLPMALLQATSTQNDLVASLWLLLVIASLPLRREAAPRDWLLSGSSLGLGLLTKITAGVFAVPFVVWALVRAWRRSPGAAFAGGGIIAGSVLLIAGPHHARNLRVFGNPLGPAEASGSASLSIAPRFRYAEQVGSNLLRNAAVHTATPIRPLNARIEEFVRRVHRACGMDPDDPATTWMGTRFHLVFGAHEDLADNPAHFGFVLLAAAALVAMRQARDRTWVAYAACLLAAALIFCALFKWQPWVSRLHLPLFLAAGPLVAVVGERFLSRRALAALSVPFFAVALWATLRSWSRPFFGESSVFVAPRFSQLFANARGEEARYRAALSALSRTGCRDVGLVLNENDLEYPIWDASPGVRFRHVQVANPSTSLSERRAAPCALFATREVNAAAISAGADYTERFRSGPVSVWASSGQRGTAVR